MKEETVRSRLGSTDGQPRAIGERAARVGTLALALLAGVFVPPLGTNRPAEAIKLVSTYTWPAQLDTSGYVHVAGVVQNDTRQYVTGVVVAFGFYNRKGRLLDTGYASSAIWELKPSEYSPFIELFKPPAGFWRYKISSKISFIPTKTPPDHEFTTKITRQYIDQTGVTHLVGTAKNDASSRAGDVSIVLTFVNSKGLTVNTATVGLTSPADDSLDAHRSGSFAYLYRGAGSPPYSTYSLLGQALKK
jgi:hypothetical protein